MSKPEQTFWNLIKDHVPGDKSRVENISDPGMPDVSGVYGDRDYWIELKVCSNKGTVRHPETLLRPAQNVWIKRRVKHGSIVFVLVKYPNFETQEMHLYIAKYAGFELYKVFKKEKNQWLWFDFQVSIMDHLATI